MQSLLGNFCSKWLPILDCLAIYQLKMAANPLCFGHLSKLLLGPVQTRPYQLCSKWLPFPFNWAFDYQLLKMAANPWLLGHVQSRPDQLCSKWLSFYFYLAIWLQILLFSVLSWSVVLKMAATNLLIWLHNPHAPWSNPDLISFLKMAAFAI